MIKAASFFTREAAFLLCVCVGEVYFASSFYKLYTPAVCDERGVKAPYKKPLSFRSS